MRGEDPKNEGLTPDFHTIRQIAKAVVPKNPHAKYVIVSNPVDAMATLFKEISQAAWAGLE